MNLQPVRKKIIGRREFLRNSVGTEYKTGGATLDGSAFESVMDSGYVKAGTAVYRDAGTGLYKPWGSLTEATEQGAGLTAEDVAVLPNQNPIVGILAAGHPLESKCTGVTANFKEAAKGRIVFDI